MNLKDYIRSIKDYPKKGILFRDITTLIKNEKAFCECIDQIVNLSKKFQFNKTALQNLNKQLDLRVKALPTIKNKEAALRLEVKKAKDKIPKKENIAKTYI